MPPRRPDGCLVYRLRQATRKATRAYDRHLNKAGLGIAQFGLLQTISMNEGASVSVIAEVLDMDRTTLSRNLGPLLSQGLIQLGDGPDRRTRAVQMTDAGQELLRQGQRQWRIARDETEHQIGKEETAALKQLLSTLLDRLPPD